MPVDLSTYQGVDLIGDAARNEFRAAMMDIKATFHVTPIVYKVLKVTRSRFMESVVDDSTYDTYNLDAMVEYGQLVEDKYIWTPTGAAPEARIKITMNVDYLDQQGLWDNATQTPKMNGKEDQVFIAGKEYRITEIPVLEGPIEERNIHVIIYAEPTDKDTE